MAGSQQIPDHMQWMGKLIVDLQSLEFALRAFLGNYEAEWKNQGGPSFLHNIAEGQQLEVNAFTNYDTLAKLINKYNSKIHSKHPDLEVDPTIARIRDALAHGRIAGLSPSANEPQRLVKYSQPKNGVVYVTDFHILTESWFNDKIGLVYENVKKVQQANEAFGHV